MSSIILSPSTEAARSKKVVAVTPFGSTVLIERLNPQEVLHTNLYVSEETKTGQAPQAYVVALGPKLDESCGVKIGDRVILQGSYVPVPNPTGSQREHGVIELHNIKAVITEE